MTGVGGTISEMEAALRAVGAFSLEALSDDDLERVVAALAHLRSTVDALWLQASACAERRQLHRRHHERDAATWLATVSGERPGTARRDLELAQALAAAPLVAEAAAEHGLSKAKTTELARAASLPGEVIQHLAEEAASLSVPQVARAVSQACLEHDVAPPAVEPCCEVLRTHDRARVSATLDLVGAEVLEVALDAYAEAAKLSKELPYAQRRAAALVGLAQHYLDHADDVPTSRVGRPHVLVMVDLDTLQAGTGGAATLASGAVVRGDEARRLAEDANVTRIITKGRSEVLDVGRTTRSIPPHLAKAVIARDRHCRYVGCSSPPWACEIHHRTPWARNGPTSLENLGLLCWHHHRVVHANGDEVMERGDGRWHVAAPAARAA